MSPIPDGYGLTSDERAFLRPRRVALWRLLRQWRTPDGIDGPLLIVAFLLLVAYLCTLPWPPARAEVPQTNAEACLAWRVGDYEMASSSVREATALCSSLGV